ncbi:MAG: metal ABC transporter permease [Planctomycetota bacterium]|nr:metal ABC transporter permease [Planctomycetota bacterium]
MNWNELDTWIVLTATFVAMACALPGVFLLLSRQSMVAHGIAHAVLPGIVAAHLIHGGVSTAALMLGAVVAGILCATLTRFLENATGVDSGAALGISFTTLFAIGLTMQRLLADHVHIEPSHVLYGSLETSIFEVLFEDASFPAAARRGLLALGLNALLVGLLFKELTIATFDPEHGASVGSRPKLMHYLLMASSAFTCVVAFEAVGSILVVAMMIIPPACASLFASNLRTMIVLSLVFAAATALLGHVLSVTAFGPATTALLGYESAGSTNTAGGIAVTAGLLLVAGLVARWLLDQRGAVRPSEG